MYDSIHCRLTLFELGAETGLQYSELVLELENGGIYGDFA